MFKRCIARYVDSCEKNPRLRLKPIEEKREEVIVFSRLSICSQTKEMITIDSRKAFELIDTEAAQRSGFARQIPQKLQIPLFFFWDKVD